MLWHVLNPKSKLLEFNVNDTSLSKLIHEMLEYKDEHIIYETNQNALYYLMLNRVKYSEPYNVITKISNINNIDTIITPCIKCITSIIHNQHIKTIILIDNKKECICEDIEYLSNYWTYTYGNYRVYINLDNLNYIPISYKTIYGTIGFFGNLGYEINNINHIDNEKIISLHAPSRLTIKTIHSISVKGYYSPLTKNPPKLTFYCNEENETEGKFLGELKVPDTFTSAFILVPGIYNLYINTTRFKWAQGMWIIESCQKYINIKLDKTLNVLHQVIIFVQCIENADKLNRNIYCDDINLLRILNITAFNNYLTTNKYRIKIENTIHISDEYWKITADAEYPYILYEPQFTIQNMADCDLSIIRHLEFTSKYNKMTEKIISGKYCVVYIPNMSPAEILDAIPEEYKLYIITDIYHVNYKGNFDSIEAIIINFILSMKCELYIGESDDFSDIIYQLNKSKTMILV